MIIDFFLNCPDFWGRIEIALDIVNDLKLLKDKKTKK